MAPPARAVVNRSSRPKPGATSAGPLRERTDHAHLSPHPHRPLASRRLHARHDARESRRHADRHLRRRARGSVGLPDGGRAARGGTRRLARPHVPRRPRHPVNHGLTRKDTPMLDKFRTTTDLLTGKRYRWNTTAICTYTGKQWQLPSRCTAHTSDWLAPDRVPAKLLRELNPTR